MLGAYSTYVVQTLLPPSLQNWSLAFAIPLAFVVAGAVGIAIERLVIRFLYTRPLETLLATWGVSLILQQLVRSLFGANNRLVSNPPFMSGAFEIGGLSITTNRLWIIVLSALVFIGLQLVLRATPFGLQMRAVTQNRRMAASMGISTARIDMLAFGLGSGVAGIAGVALSQIDNVSPNLGQGYIIDSFMVVVFGGVGNLWGTAFGALVDRARQQAARAADRRGPGPDRAPDLHHPVHPETAERALRASRPGGGSMSARLDQLGLVFVAILVVAAILVPLLSLAVSAEFGFLPAAIPCAAARQISLLCDPRRRARSRLGLLRHPVARSWRVLRPRRLCDGHVSDAADRDARRLRQSDPAGFHGVPELEGAARRLVGVQLVPLCDADGGAGPRDCWRSPSAGSRSARASPASISRSSPRR